MESVSEALLWVLRTLSVSCLFKGCFESSHIRFLHSTVLRCLGYIARLGFTLRWEGMAASTNCSSNVNCCATLRTYLAQFVVHREQRSTLTEERNSRTACSSKITTWHLADAHAPANGKLPHTRVRDGSLTPDAPANGIHPHTRVRDGSFADAFSLVFMQYLWNAVISGKSPH